VGLNEDAFLSRDFTRLKQIEHLLAAHEIDESFYWTTRGHDVTPAADRV
jgi:hypothetical protein